jgi:putative ABC transport system substrate-binding protein
MLFDMRRREFIMLLGGAATWSLAPHVATAQPSNGMHRIAMLSGFAATDPAGQARVAALQQGLKELGWAEGRNIRIDFRWGTGERHQMVAFATELIDLKPELIIGVTTPAVTALVQETKTIPILFVNIVDPLGRGFISNMARPGGNVTGFINFEFSLGGKWLQTLKQIAPAVRRVALLFNPHTAPFARSFVQVAEAAAPSFGHRADRCRGSRRCRARAHSSGFRRQAGRRLDRPARCLQHRPSRSDHCAGGSLSLTRNLSAARVCRERRSDFRRR